MHRCKLGIIDEMRKVRYRDIGIFNALLIIVYKGFNYAKN